MIEFKKLDYTDFLKYEPTFLSLDISVRSTGWVKSVNGEVTWGTKTLEAEDELGRRKEFREFLISMLGDIHFPVVFVANPVYKPFAKRGFGGIGLIICYPKMNCGTNVLNSISEWFIVRPSSKSNTFDKSKKTNKLT